MSGTTPQAGRIVGAIDDGRLGLNLLGDELFEKAYLLKGGDGDAPLAFAYGEQLFMRRSSINILSETVHEGTHGLDYLRGFSGNTFQWEKRAFFFERQFQQWTDETIEFGTPNSMLNFIYENY